MQPPNQVGIAGAPARPQPKKSIWRKVVVIVVLMVGSVFLFTGACAIFAAVHYFVNESHGIAQISAASHPAVHAKLGDPVTANPRFCWSAVVRDEVEPRVALDEHTFAVVGPKGEGQVEVTVRATTGVTRSYEVMEMTFVLNGKNIQLEPAELPEAKRIKRVF